jgi:5-methylcytosine-specific restriction endonuclease McrA
VQFTVSRETEEKLRQVQDLLRREIPDGDPGQIFDRALTLLLDDIARRKLAATPRPRPGRPTDPRSRHVPAHIRRAVWLRDGAQCAFVGRNGRRCGERAFLEFHHREAYAHGGEMTLENLALRCRAHNVYEAELVFGPYDAGRVQEGLASYVAARAHLPRGKCVKRVKHSARPRQRAPALRGRQGY